MQVWSSAVEADRNLHSRIVLWLKLFLPFAALALLSTLFLFARQSGPPPDIPFADLDRMAQEQRINAPRLSGVAQDGSVIAISAVVAKPEGDKITIESPSLSVTTPDGSSLTIQAGAGLIDNATQSASLTGLARLSTSTGYLMETSGLTADLQSGVVTSHGPLEVQAPFGALSAGTVTIQSTSSGQGQRMDFAEGVKLIYTPPTNDE